MQEDDKETSESQPQPEEQPSSASAADESQPQPEGQPPSASEADESQPRVGMQPPPGTPIPPAAPIPLPPSERRKRWQYLLGLVLGLIPLIVFLVGYGIDLRSRAYLSGIGPFLLGLPLYVIEIVVTIAFLANKNARFAGYGLLTAFLATPIVVAIGCSVLPNVIHA
jgi:hypothetical protein